MSSPKNLLVDLWMATMLGVRLVDDLLADTPLSTDEFALYGLIVDLGPVTATELARWTGMPLTTLSTLLRRCEARGELTRVANPNDRRSSHLVLSERGMAVYLGCVPPLLDALAKLERTLSTSENAVRISLQDVDAALRAMLDTPPRPYEVTPETDERQLGYAGRPLSAAQRAEVLAFIDWIRHRDRES
jgi:DNA-binding MarR family transcriptional regulator